MSQSMSAKRRSAMRARAVLARQQALQAASQVVPLATSARTSAGQGVWRARTGAALRIERTGYAFQDQALKVSAMLRRLAARVAPPPPRRRRRWPFLLAGLVVAAGALVMLNRRRSRTNLPVVEETTSEEALAGTASRPAAAKEEASKADVNGRVPTA
ncbi:MAG TPA: hypothetical protein VGS19_19510 [Streptosporangiaceae bacterium]|nr:hypothetical protein [Streptosporangiaceae bacterium]